MVDNDTIQASLDKVNALAEALTPKGEKVMDWQRDQFPMRDTGTQVTYTRRTDTGARRTIIVDDNGESKLMGPIRYMDDPRMVAANNDPVLEARAFIMAGMALGTTDHVADVLAAVGGASNLLDAWWLVNDPTGVLRKKTARERAWDARQITDAQDRLDHKQGLHSEYLGGCPVCWREWCVIQGWEVPS